MSTGNQRNVHAINRDAHIMHKQIIFEKRLSCAKTGTT